MTGYRSSILVLSIFSMFSVLAVPVDAWQNALCSVRISGLDDHITCSSMHDSLTISAGDNISLHLDNQTNTITVSAIIPASEPATISGQTLVASGDIDGMGLLVHDIQPGDRIVISFTGDFTASNTNYSLVSLSVNNVIQDTASFASLPQFAVVPFTLQDHYTALGGEDLVITISSDGMVSSGKIVWSQYR